MLAPATRMVLEQAGIERGMRVLDLGTGAGDVAFEVADMVGSSGSVLGVDQSASALRWAARRLETRDISNVTFLRDDLHTVEIADRFDAVVGRLVLLYTPHPAEVLRRYAALVRKGGLIVAMEYEMRAAGSIPSVPLSERVVGWITEAFGRSNLDASLGARLEPIMRAAGLTDPTVVGLQSYFAPDDPAGARLAAATVRTLLPVIVRTGVAEPEEIDIDTLEERCATSLADGCAIFKPPVLVGAWARI
ncbi:class I SAM-dependent methyltransferase [Solicola gregarius]|uniref:Class I SAM-dependent methyltransferase n=2 Tax=Solicola gregarius TaxID=2908642 RepID=A0AA46YLT1_9ACTN|nr:class I SAM-dependent methyltransferase [Solicola gregarius]